MARFFNTPRHLTDDNSLQIFAVDGTTRTAVPAVNDNDYRTSSTETTYVAEVYGATPTTNTTVNWVFVKGSGIDSYTITVPTDKGSGAGVTGRVIPTTVMTPEMTNTPTTVAGIQHDLLDLASLDTDGTLTCQEVQIEFTGTSVRIYELMFMSEALYFDPEASFENIGWLYQNNALEPWTNILGVNRPLSSLASRGKWQVNYSVFFDRDKSALYESFMTFLSTQETFVFAPQYPRYPARVYPALWRTNDIGQRYKSRMVSAGIICDVGVLEA